MERSSVVPGVEASENSLEERAAQEAELVASSSVVKAEVERACSPVLKEVESSWAVKEAG